MTETSILGLRTEVVKENVTLSDLNIVMICFTFEDIDYEIISRVTNCDAAVTEFCEIHKIDHTKIVELLLLK